MTKAWPCPSSSVLPFAHRPGFCSSASPVYFQVFPWSVETAVTTASSVSFGR
ncbi:MAG TPA: hypothetical protein VGM10_34010 [Actinocrinis sp.]|jgi:hypothetical protein